MNPRNVACLVARGSVLGVGCVYNRHARDPPFFNPNVNGDPVRWTENGAAGPSPLDATVRVVGDSAHAPDNVTIRPLKMEAYPAKEPPHCEPLATTSHALAKMSEPAGLAT